VGLQGLVAHLWVELFLILLIKNVLLHLDQVKHYLDLVQYIKNIKQWEITV
jgi:hypothetical protein